MNPSEIGERAEGAVLAALIRQGYRVLVPFGSHLRYDLLIERSPNYFRVQVKNGRLREDRIVFNTVSSTGTGEKRIVREYSGDADLFAVYCFELDKVYLVPVKEVGRGTFTLRLAPPKNGQAKNIHLAKDYELCVYGLPV